MTETARKGVGSLVKDMLRDGKSNAQILEAVKEKFPDSNTSATTISWYRGDLRRKGEEVLSARDAATKNKTPSEDVDPLDE